MICGVGKDILCRFLRCKQKKKIVDEYVKNYSPFEKKEGLDFDLRGYSTYVKTHNLETKEITPDIMNMFERQTKL